ncbi:hypothetical protein D3C77_615330 [compost metagenome]
MLRAEKKPFAEVDFTQLKKAAEDGHPESMFLYSRVLELRHDGTGAKQWLEQAAAEGYPHAVMAVSERANLH